MTWDSDALVNFIPWNQRLKMPHTPEFNSEFYGKRIESNTQYLSFLAAACSAYRKSDLSVPVQYTRRG